VYEALSGYDDHPHDMMSMGNKRQVIAVFLYTTCSGYLLHQRCSESSANAQRRGSHGEKLWTLQPEDEVGHLEKNIIGPGRMTQDRKYFGQMNAQ
jgi:hypothetical protein